MNIKHMNDLMIWVTYHDDKQIPQYGLKETDTIRLFKGNDVSIDGDSINHLNRFYSELTTMYYVWKNGLDMNPARYMEKAQQDFRYDDVNYQCCAVAFLAERLISCYIVCNMKPFCVKTL